MSESANNNITRFTLDNGLRFIHSYDPSAVMSTFNVLYNVGARDERPELTGMAHLFEHLMFGGSINVPSFDGAIESAGGSNNAWTSNDFTNFYDILPASNIETAFWVESDRMLAPLISQKALDAQKSVVIEEFKQVCLNRPYGDMAHHLRAMSFDNHPYRYPTIGLTPDHIAAVTREDAEKFFYTHYSPNNAVVSISGAVEPERVRELAEKWFGSIPVREVAPRTYEQLPLKIDAPRRVEVTGSVPATAVTVAFRMPGRKERGYKELDILTDVLASGRASRMFRDLVINDKLFTAADASILGSEHRGLVMLNARLSSDSDADIDTAVKRLTDEAMQLAQTAPAEAEMERARTRFESELTFGELNGTNRAAALAMCEMQGEDPDKRVENYRAVTAEDVRQITEETITPQQAMTLVYRPEKN